MSSRRGSRGHAREAGEWCLTSACHVLERRGLGGSYFVSKSDFYNRHGTTLLILAVNNTGRDMYTLLNPQSAKKPGSGPLLHRVRVQDGLHQPAVDLGHDEALGLRPLLVAAVIEGVRVCAPKVTPTDGWVHKEGDVVGAADYLGSKPVSDRSAKSAR